MFQSSILTAALIITTYNRPDALALTLKSVLAQSKMPDEVIIADDGSTIETKALIDSFRTQLNIPLKHVWQKDEGFRVAKIRNKAIKVSNSAYILFTDGDMILHSKFVESHLQFSKAHQFCFGHRVLLNQTTTIKAIEYQKIDFSIFSNGITNRHYALHQPILAKTLSKNRRNADKVRTCNFACWKSDAEKVNGFNEDFIGWGKEDAEFAQRLLNADVQALDIKFSAVAFHLDHQENFKKADETIFEQNNAIYKNTIEKRLTFCKNGLVKQ